MDNADKKAIAPSNEAFQFRMGLNDNKAGMEGLDKEKINKIIMDATKGSRFYDNELKKDQQVNQRIEKMMQQKAQLTSQQIKNAQMQVDKLALELDRSRDLSRVIVHIDMDAFYAAVEMRDNPELKYQPMAVGSMSMLSTSNYLARRFGVRAAMPGFIAKRLCPNLTIVPLNFDKYRAVSKEVRKILADYDDNFLPLSLDEAFLDITEHLGQRLSWPEDKRRYFIRTNNTDESSASPGPDDPPVQCESSDIEEMQCTSPVLFEDSPSLLADENMGHNSSEGNGKPLLENAVVFGISVEEAVKEMRFRIEQKTTLTASAGIAPNMMLAKICSDKNKPNGQYRIPHDRQAVMDFVKDLPIRKVPGIGKVTEKMLQALGVTTCNDLSQQGALLALLFSEISWHNFLNISLGIGSTHIEKTFSEISAADEQYSLCRELCKDLAEDLCKKGLKGKTVTLKLKNVKFEVKTRASTVMSAVSTEEEIFAVAKEILKAEIEFTSPELLQLRLMGVRVSGFLNEEEKKHHQKSIINFLRMGKSASTSSAEKPEKLDQVTQAPVPHRESFFNQKRAARQLNTQEHSTHSIGFTNTTQNVTSPPTSDEAKEISVFENLSQNPDLTCPICFHKQNTWDLEGFNKHIDKCLSRTPLSSVLELSNSCKEAPMLRNKGVENEGHISDHENVDVCKNNLMNTLVGVRPFNIIDDCVSNNEENTVGKLQDFEQGTRVDHNHCTMNDADLKSARDHVVPSEHMLVGRQVESKQHGDQKGPTQPCSSGLLENPTFICPVCNSKQDTIDLAIFNRHVDVCLNKGIIQELTEEVVGPSKSASTLQHAGCMGRGHQSINTTVRTKRPGVMNQNPASKKPKPNSSANTIDRFFK
ncbi:hypothetical protein FKM82_000347 [Ascaphus truei]